MRKHVIAFGKGSRINELKYWTWIGCPYIIDSDPVMKCRKHRWSHVVTFASFLPFSTTSRILITRSGAGRALSYNTSKSSFIRAFHNLVDLIPLTRVVILKLNRHDANGYCTPIQSHGSLNLKNAKDYKQLIYSTQIIHWNWDYKSEILNWNKMFYFFSRMVRISQY